MSDRPDVSCPQCTHSRSLVEGGRWCENRVPRFGNEGAMPGPRPLSVALTNEARRDLAGPIRRLVAGKVYAPLDTRAPRCRPSSKCSTPTLHAPATSAARTGSPPHSLHLTTGRRVRRHQTGSMSSKARSSMQVRGSRSSLRRAVGDLVDPERGLPIEIAVPVERRRRFEQQPHGRESAQPLRLVAQRSRARRDDRHHILAVCR
jgi:hypothetical protein